ncbi:MAG: hypothetical protein HRU77_08690 [Gammaproteobacteria bacterium]|nr:MAG: hypothetical protein HRU77_08690 [Gammaproteobacteria bacterium]
MPYQTDERLKSYLDTNQLHREQMCRAILSIDKRFSDVRPRHPRGGRDGGRDIEALYRDEQVAFGAAGFVNQANDSEEQRKVIKGKFQDDLDSAVFADKKPSVFIFFTNINLTIGEKDALIHSAKSAGLLFCEILDRERLRIALDSPDGFWIRFQYLNIPLSEEEQASFFARWGDDIQSVISTGFQRIESSLGRIMFLQEASAALTHLTLSFELDAKYPAEEICHFRLFCSMYLKEPKHNILSILFGSSDKSNRMRTDLNFSAQPAGIKYGIGSGQWEQHIDIDAEKKRAEDEEDNEKYTLVGSGSRIGMNDVEFLSISYNKDSFFRLTPWVALRDLDDAMFLPFANKSLAEKIKAIHVYSNGYKLKEIGNGEFYVDREQTNPRLPIVFSEGELADPWVRIRPKTASAFHLRFFEETPVRMFVPEQTKDSLESRRRITKR